MLRTHTCGELRISDVQKVVTICGWVQRIRNLGGMTFIDIRDRYGVTQVVIDEKSSNELHSIVERLGREFEVPVSRLTKKSR